ncbi:hypothetical protein BGZ59_008718 [Podila verticillata]|nr:hypothetical protein BGZ59_008718 [Podila verticillata]
MQCLYAKVCQVESLLAFTTVSSAEHCIDTETTSTDPTIAASKSKGNLYIKLNHATKLTDKDWFGKSDPFYRDVGSTSPTDTLYIKAVDRDTLKSDMIGDAKISLNNVFQTGRERPRDYKLPKWLDFSDNGWVNMQMQYTDDNTP